MYSRLHEGRFTPRTRITLRTADLRDEMGREVVLRRVQVWLRVYADGSSCTVTCRHGDPSRTDVDRTVADLREGKRSLEFLFLESDEYMAVEITVDGGGAEAPAIEGFTVWKLSGHMAR
jgi:hypothetical protein